MSGVFGLLAPFQRDGKHDFAGGHGETLRHSHLRQAMLTRRGELSWDTDRGCQLHMLRHAKLDAAALEIAKVYVSQVVHRDLPHEAVASIAAHGHGAALSLDVLFVNEHGNEATITVDLGPVNAAEPPER